MSDRPDLQKDLDSKIFRSYYYLKEELTAFCRAVVADLWELFTLAVTT